MANTVIQTQALTRRFGDTVAVNELSFDVHAGEIFGFLGHNGAGKTTTVRLLNGVLKFDGGDATVLGMSPASDGAAIRARTGVLTETPSLDERLTAVQNLTLYAQMYNVDAHTIPTRINDLLTTFDLQDRADEKVGGYSKGMKQRLALARALVHEPDVLFLDEPTSALDPVATRDVHHLIQRLSHEQGRTVFICTHNLNEAQNLCDRVAVMEHGRLMAIGAPAELAQQTGQGIRYAISVARAQSGDAVQAVNSLTGVMRVEAQNDSLTLHLTTRDTMPDVLAALVNARVRVFAAEPLSASLEDIYFAIHNRSAGGES